MSSKLLLIFLSIFLLVQSSLGKALPSTEDSTTVLLDLSQGSAPPRSELARYLFTKISELADITLNTAKKLFQDVIADISASDTKNEEITKRLEGYTEFVSKIEKAQTENDTASFIDKFQLTSELAYQLHDYSSKPIENPDSIYKLFENSLKENGFSNFKKQFEDNFETFAKDFSETTESEMNSVTIEKSPHKTNIQELLKMFKTENDNKKRFAILAIFLGIL